MAAEKRVGQARRGKESAKESKAFERVWAATGAYEGGGEKKGGEGGGEKCRTEAVAQGCYGGRMREIGSISADERKVSPNESKEATRSGQHDMKQHSKRKTRRRRYASRKQACTHGSALCELPSSDVATKSLLEPPKRQSQNRVG